MLEIAKKSAFVLLSTNHGMMIINKNDYRDYTDNQGETHRLGVGHQLLETGQYEPIEMDFTLGLLERRRKSHGDGVIAIDCGANIGLFSIEWARLMTDWGRVISFEAQEKIFYAFAGNIVLNNCLNIQAIHAAIGNQVGTMQIPEPNYFLPGSFGSLDLEERPKNMFIGQEIDYCKTVSVDLKSIDSLMLERLDFLKIDVEGMEEAVILGAENSIKKLKPIILVEVLKSDQDAIIRKLMSLNYKIGEVGINCVAIHKDDPQSEFIPETIKT